MNLPSVTPAAHTSGYARRATLLLMAAYAFNSMDRSIISVIGQPLKLDLGLTDTQLGLLGGTAFASLYAIGGIPIARISERLSRVNIITAALIAWSALTALLGAAGSFLQLLVIRVAIGIAEAGCSPPAHSLISDLVPAAKRASMLSLYSCGISLGYLLGAAIGGYIAVHAGWRVACVAVGLPGIAMALIIRTTVREPARGRSEEGSATPDPGSVRNRLSLRSEVGELFAVARTLLLDWSVLNVILGITIGSFAAYGSWAFVPAFYSRVFGLDYGTIGLVSGMAGGVSVGLGILAGGVIADWLAKRNKAWYALVPAIGTALAIPFYAIAFLSQSWQTSALILAIPGLFQYASLGPTFGIIQNVAGARSRATASALLYICLSVFALGGGPPFTGWLIDHLAGREFTHLTGSKDVFEHACPVGREPTSAVVGAHTACHAALVHATRNALIVTVLIYGLSALHYFLASFGIGRALTRRAVAN